MSECPICQKETQKAFKPFCSERCKMIDLGKWLKGSYAIPAVELDDISDEDLQNLDDSTPH